MTPTVATVAQTSSGPSDPAPPQTPTAAQARAGLDRFHYTPTTLEFAHPISTASAKAVVDAHPEAAIIGFSFDQGDTSGEFFLSDTYGFAEFADDFVDTYGVEPAIDGVVTVAKAPQSSSESRSTLTPLLPEPVLDAANEKPAVMPKDPVRVGLPSVDRATNSDGEFHAPTFTPLYNGGTDWPGSYVDIYAMNMNNGASSVLATWVQWESGTVRSPKNMPSDWGIEFNGYTRDADAHGTRPACVGSNDFWQSGELQSWSITLLSGRTGNVQKYYDYARASDSCKILDTTVGVGAPRNIGAESDGSSQIATRIQTKHGQGSRNPAGWYFQAVSHDCIGDASAVCMGLNTGRDFPLDGAKSRPVFSWSTSPTRYFPGCYRWHTRIPSAYSINCQTGD